MRALTAALLIMFAIGITGCAPSDDGGDDAAPAAEASDEGDAAEGSGDQ